MFHFRKTSGFTLVELVISITIFGMMSLAITSIYIQTTYLGQKMRQTRHLSETAREITERIADDVRQKWIHGNTLSDGTSYVYWNTPDTYSLSGSEVLSVGDGTTKYVYGKKEILGWTTVINHCEAVDKIDPKTHCGLYLVNGSDYTNAFNLVDSFIPEESQKRVKIENLKFYISGDGKNTEKKVTLIFTLALMPRIGIPSNLIGDTRLHIQTTISERFFKENT